MGISAKVILDSVNSAGVRLTTVEATYPRIILAEVNTHRALSRNTASSRAIPVNKMIERVNKDPFSPVFWGKNQAGMQAAEELQGDERLEAMTTWAEARDHAVECAARLVELGLHKQIANRLLEPFQYVTSIISATDWNNMFFQRCHKDAQPEFQVLAKCIKEAYDNSKPKFLQMGHWHTPYISAEDSCLLEALAEEKGTGVVALTRQVSVARCARVSYLNHDGVRSLEDDLTLFNRLGSNEAYGGKVPGHWSPFEHVAMSMGDDAYLGNFRGFKQLRKFISVENVLSL